MMLGEWFALFAWLTGMCSVEVRASCDTATRRRTRGNTPHGNTELPAPASLDILRTTKTAIVPSVKAPASDTAPTRCPTVRYQQQFPDPDWRPRPPAASRCASGAHTSEPKYARSVDVYSTSICTQPVRPRLRQGRSPRPDRLAKCVPRSASTTRSISGVRRAPRSARPSRFAARRIGYPAPPSGPGDVMACGFQIAATDGEGRGTLCKSAFPSPPELGLELPRGRASRPARVGRVGGQILLGPPSI